MGEAALQFLLCAAVIAFAGSALTRYADAIADLTGLAAILVTTIAVMGQLYRVERRIHLVEPDAVLVVLLILGAQALIFWFG